MKFLRFATVAALAALSAMVFMTASASASSRYGTVFPSNKLKVKTIDASSGGVPLDANVMVRPAAPSEEVIFRNQQTTAGAAFPVGANSVSDSQELKPVGRCGRAVDGGNPNPNRVICDSHFTRSIEIFTYDGNDTVTIDPAITVGASIRTGHGADTVTGSQSDDSIRTYNEDDTVYGEGGDDRIDLGRGVAYQTAYGDAGPSDPPVSDGDDDLRARQGGFSEEHGGGGADELSSGNAGSLLVGDLGFDSFRGDDGDDTLDATESPAFADDDRLSCGGGNDTYLFDLGVDPLPRVTDHCETQIGS
jgi:hypothetical protein